MAERAKLSDVARLAGVSPATASRVLNDNGRVDPELAARVQEATRQLGYRQNSLARGLRRRANNVVGAVIPDITNPFFTDLVRGIEDVVREHDLLLVLCNSDETAEKERLYLRLLVDQQVAGVVIAPVGESVGWLGTLPTGTPVVTVDRRISGGEIDSITLDNLGGAAALTRHLLAGTRDIATIAGPAESTTGRERLAGFRAAMAEVDARVRSEWVLESDFSEQGGYAAALELFGGRWRPGAVFVANNAMTLGTMRAMTELGLGPKDVALASFDPLSWSADPGHRVAVLAVPTYEMGRSAARMLIQRIEGSTEPPRSVQLDPGLVRA